MKSKLLSKRVLVLFILLLGFSPLSQAFAQFGITGTVTDWARNPIIGATVVIQGTNIGTTTDFDGHYTIYAIPGDTLILSMLLPMVRWKSEVLEVLLTWSYRTILLTSKSRKTIR